MASFTALQPSFIFSSTPNLSFSSSNLSFFLPKRGIQEPSPNLGLCCKKRDDFSTDESCEKLEDEIYKFMERSANPNDFPRREELIEAGRADLAEAIAKRGGWFAFGWNLEEDDQVGRSMEKKEDGKDDMGIEGILSRLEKERNFAYGVSSIEKNRVDGKRSWRNGGLNRREDGSNSRKGTSADGRSTITMPMWRIWSLQRAGNQALKFEDEIVPGGEGSVYRNCIADSDVDENAEALPNERRIDNNFSGDVTVDENAVSLSSEVRSATHNFSRDVSEDGNAALRKEEKSINHDFMGGVPKYENTEAHSGEQSNGPITDTEDICQNQIHRRLKHMESELTSTLRSMRSRSKLVDSYKVQMR